MNNRRDPAAPAGQFGPNIYATWRESSLGEITETLEQRLLLRLAGDLHGRTMLDVGCGDGTLTRIFARAGISSVIGCDIDPRMIARATAQAAQENQPIPYIVANALHLPFACQKFDIVTAVTILAFIPNPERAIHEMARVLKPGGRLIIADLGKWNFWAARRRIRAWLGAPLWRAATFRTASQLRALAPPEKLQIEHVSGAIFFPPYLPLARLLAPWDPILGERTTLGAAFIAVQLRKK